jgi:hypothetical protein
MKNELEIMRIWRLPPLGKLVVEANGERYTSLGEIKDPKLKQRLLAAIGELIPFVGGYQSLVDIGLAPALTPPTPTSAADPADSEELTREQEAFLARLQAERDELASRKPGRLRSISSAEPLVTFTEKGEVKPAIPIGPKSIAEQIDEILQKHLKADPKLADRLVHLEENPAGGLHIRVDGVYYEKPADVPDREVQLAIKMAVKEWNAT